MHVHLRAVGDEAHEGVLGEKANGRGRDGGGRERVGEGKVREMCQNGGQRGEG